MTVKLVCESCKKGLKIPETVLGRKIKCPSCGAVFLAQATAVQRVPPKPEPATLLPDLSLDDEGSVRSASEPVADVMPGLPGREVDDAFPPPTRKKAAAIVEDEDEPKPRKKAILLEDEDEEPKPRKKAAVILEDDEDEPRPRKKAAALVEDDDEHAKPAKKKKAAVVEEDDEDKPKKKAKAKAPWYLFLFSLLPLVLVIGVPFGAPYAGSISSDFMTDLYVGIGLAAGTTLLCLLLTVLPFPRWLRVLLVFFFLLVGFGAAAGWVLYEADQTKIKTPQKHANP